MITEDYVSFETAQLLKAKGFDNDILITDCWYDEEDNLYKHGNFSYSGAPFYHKETCYQAPTLQMAMKWLRKNFNIHVEVVPAVEGTEFTNYWHCYAEDLKAKYPFGQFVCDKPTYEEGCDATIKYCLENLI